MVEPVRADKLGAITSPRGTLVWEPPFAAALGVVTATPCSFVVRAAATNVNLRFQGCAVPVPLCRPVWYPGLGTTLRCPSQSRPVPSLVWEPPSAGLPRWSPRPHVLTCGPRGCDFRAMASLCRPVRPCPALSGPLPLCPVPWSGNQPSHTLLGGPRDPLFSLVVRAAAANVNPRTRLSHMTEIPPLLGS